MFTPPKGYFYSFFLFLRRLNILSKEFSCPFNYCQYGAKIFQNQVYVPLGSHCAVKEVMIYIPRSDLKCANCKDPSKITSLLQLLGK